LEGPWELRVSMGELGAGIGIRKWALVIGSWKKR